MRNSSSEVSTWRTLFELAAWLAITFSAAAVGALASANAGAFYQQLSRPSWAPPGWLFGPVWSTLYVLMGISAWLVWRERHLVGVRSALTLYVVQLAANALWTWLFFVWHQGRFAFVEVMVLWALIAATAASFWRINRAAALLLLPYFVWVGFAAALTFAIWTLNPQLLL